MPTLSVVPFPNPARQTGRADFRHIRHSFRPMIAAPISPPRGPISSPARWLRRRHNSPPSARWTTCFLLAPSSMPSSTECRLRQHQPRHRPPLAVLLRGPSRRRPERTFMIHRTALPCTAGGLLPARTIVDALQHRVPPSPAPAPTSTASGGTPPGPIPPPPGENLHDPPHRFALHRGRLASCPHHRRCPPAQSAAFASTSPDIDRFWRYSSGPSRRRPERTFMIHRTALPCTAGGLLPARTIVDALQRNLPPPSEPAAELAQESARAAVAAVSEFPRSSRTRNLLMGTTHRPGENRGD